MINYPNGKPFKLNPTKVGSNQSDASSNIKYGGRGMTLEKILNNLTITILSMVWLLYIRNLLLFKL